MQLPKQLIVQYVPDFKFWEWTPSHIPDFPGPKDLADILVSYRAKLSVIEQEGGQPSHSVAALSDASLVQVLTVAYRASFFTEESRPVRACLYAPPHEDRVTAPGKANALNEIGQVFVALARQERDAATNVYRLNPSLSLEDPKLISRFAPALAADDAVMVIREQQGRVYCAGITLLDFADSENDLLDMPRGWHGVGGLFVHILGPGELRVIEGNCEFTLRANQVRLYQSVSFADHVHKWHRELAATLIAACATESDWDAKRISNFDAAIDLMILWSRVLREAARMRHGGAFIVLPEITNAPIQLKYRIQPFDVGREVRQTWLSLSRAWHLSSANDVDAVVDSLEAKRRQTHKLCSASRAIGHLSGTDGCVVLDRRLTLHGFGGSIQIRNNIPRKACVQVAGKTKRKLNEADLMLQFGERHKSAFNLCKQVPGALAFVISQDGDLRLFASNKTTVYYYDLLHP
jgi:hypothetical protein